MPEKDIENIIANISKREEQESQAASQINKLKELIQKQKKIIEEKESIIQEQQQKMNEMFDIPADTEELQKLIGIQRAELNEKDQKLEIAYSEVARLEQELQGANQTQNIINNNLENAYQQLGQLKSELAQKNAEIASKNNEINTLNLKVNELQSIVDKNKTTIDELTQKLSTAELQLMEEKTELEQKLKQDTSEIEQRLKEERIQIEKKLREELFAEKEQAMKKIQELEYQLMDKELKTKETLSSAQSSISAYEDIKKKYEDLIAKYDEMKQAQLEAQKEVEKVKEEAKEIFKFKEENMGRLNILDKMKGLMEKEPFFQIFWILNDVGEAPVDQLKSAVGIPSVLIKKHIQTYIDAGIAETTEDGKIRLVGVVKKESS